MNRIPLMTSENVPSLIQCLHTILPSRPDLMDVLIILLKKVSLVPSVLSSVVINLMRMFGCVG